MTDPGFTSPASNHAPFIVTVEAFLGHTSQVQALASMVQTIVSYLPQLIHLATQQSTPQMAFPQTESPVAPNRETPLEAEPPQREVAEAYAASPTPAPARSQSRSCDPIQTGPDLDTLLSDTADSLREQVRQVHQRLDEVQKEVLKSRGEIGESSKGGSPRYFPEDTPAVAEEEGGQVGHVTVKIPPIPLNSTRTEIFFQIREKGLLKAPNPMKSHSERRDKRRYYHFHREYGLVDKQIDVIFGGPTSGCDSSSARKAYARSEVGKRPAHDENLDITFKSGSEQFPCHDDALVISIRIANAYVKRVMIDTGSSIDILYFDAFQKLGLTDKDLATLTSILTGFTRGFISPLGATTIPVTLGGEPRSKTIMVSFMVVKLPSAYNAIIGRPTLNRLTAIISTYHRLLKFPTRTGVDEVMSDPRESRQCYLTETILSKKPKVQPAAAVPQNPEDSARDPYPI
ncbi:hypothetical protein BHM03_00011679 [Ensete ventricosum]|nr:hypothetical protein BHM03_00011679 [Ensete ventricosum]